MEELKLGPNGALVYCMEYLLQNLDFLHDKVEEFCDDDYLILDCPGQLELYTHIPIMRNHHADDSWAPSRLGRHCIICLWLPTRIHSTCTSLEK